MNTCFPTPENLFFQSDYMLRSTRHGAIELFLFTKRERVVFTCKNDAGLKTPSIQTTTWQVLTRSLGNDAPEQKGE